MPGQKTTRTPPRLPRDFLRKVPSARGEEIAPSPERPITSARWGARKTAQKETAAAHRNRIITVCVCVCRASLCPCVCAHVCMCEIVCAYVFLGACVCPCMLTLLKEGLPRERARTAVSFLSFLNSKLPRNRCAVPCCVCACVSLPLCLCVSVCFCVSFR